MSSLRRHAPHRHRLRRHRLRRHRQGRLVGAFALAVGLLLLPTAGILPAAGIVPDSVASAGVPAATSAPKAGGSLTVLENSSFEGAWPGLDPATDTEAQSDENYMEAIYGNLFTLGANNKLIPELATGYHFSDGGLEVTITLRKGVEFSDGTPFNSAAVAFNIRRDLDPKNACTCIAQFPIKSITTPDPYTVVLHLSKVFAPIMSAFPGSVPDWIASPTALTKMGEKQFALKPVGAGPFEVVSDKLSDELVLKRNPHYFEKGRPYLDSLTFQVIGSDESAYQAILAGDAQAYQEMSTISLVSQAKSHMTVTTIPSALGPSVLQLNAGSAPFNNLKARQAVYYATNPETINKALEDNQGTLTQSPSGPGFLFYEPKVPGYLTYNLAKAKALVKQLGGLKVSIGGVNTASNVDILEALKSEWAQAGIDVTLDPQNLQGVIQAFDSGTFDAELQDAGSYDPAIGNGVDERYGPNAPFTGAKDPKIGALEAEGVSTLSMPAREKIYHELFAYIAKEAYSPFLFNLPSYNLTAKGVSGPGLTTPQFLVEWQDVART